MLTLDDPERGIAKRIEIAHCLRLLEEIDRVAPTTAVEEWIEKHAPNWRPSIACQASTRCRGAIERPMVTRHDRHRPANFRKILSAGVIGAGLKGNMMNRIFRSVALAVLAFLPLTGVANGLTIVVDQSNEGSLLGSQGIGGSPGSPGDPVDAQSFTAGVTGTLAGIDVYVRRNSTDLTGQNLVAEIFSATANAPSGSALGSVSVPESSVPISFAMLNIDLSSLNIPVTTGNQFAIVLHDDNKANQSTAFGWGIGGAYSGGARSYDIGGGFLVQSDDFLFKTYVTVPEASSAVLLIAGITGLAMLRKRPPRPFL